MNRAYRGKESKSGRLHRDNGILCPISLFFIDGDRRDCPLGKVEMTTLQALDIIKMYNKPLTRYNMYMKSSTSPLFTLPARFLLVCAIMEFITCFLSQTKNIGGFTADDIQFGALCLEVAHPSRKSPFNLAFHQSYHFQSESIMSLKTDKSTPLEAANSAASSFAINLLLNTAITETLKTIEKMRLEGQELLGEFKASEGPAKEKVKTAISLNIQDRKFLLKAIFTNPIEKDV